MFLAAIVVLLVVGAQQLFGSFGVSISHCAAQLLSLVFANVHVPCVGLLVRNHNRLVIGHVVNVCCMIER